MKIEQAVKIEDPVKVEEAEPAAGAPSSSSQKPPLPEDPGDELDPVMPLGKSIFVRSQLQWIVETL